MQAWLEWQSFGLALFGTWVYGRTRVWGGIVGIITAASFMAFGVMSDVPAAIWANIAFAVVHANNIRVGMKECHTK
jgi:hypothetical protein